MNPYDEAHQLASALRESEEYREYARLKEIACKSDANRALLDEYRALQFRVQARMASGERADDQDMQRLNQLGALLQFNPEASACLLAEFRFQRMLSDIFKILGSAAGIDLDMLTRG